MLLPPPAPEAAPPAPQAPPEHTEVYPNRVQHCISMHDVPWEAYEALVEANGNGPIRISYDRGEMEIELSNNEHDDVKKVLARLIELYSFFADIPIRSTGSTTWRDRPKRGGLEADESYYVEHHDTVVGQRGIDDLSKWPPPDLAIEVDVWSRSVNKLAIYARLGVPEVWCWDRGELTVLHLRGEAYEQAEASVAFPNLSMALVREGLTLGLKEGEHAAMRWLRSRMSM